MLEAKIKELVSPVKFISLVNVVVTSIGALVGILNARILGPDALGVIAVILGIYSTIATFIDVRLVDLVSKLYYQSEETKYRSNVILIYLSVSAFLGLLIGILSYSLTLAAVGYFTSMIVKLQWIVFSSFYYALNYWISAVQYQQRFSERFYLIGTWRLLGYILWVFTFLGILINQPNLDGYFFASFCATFINALITLGLSFFIWIRYEKFEFLLHGLGEVFKSYLKEIRLIFWGNIFGYAKLLHRGSDILLVGYFANDHITGLYKIARSLADSTFVFYDSMNQVYFPRLMQLLTKRSIEEYRILALRSISIAGLLTLALLFVEWMGLRYFLQYILTRKFQGAELTIIILTATLFFIIGFQMWLWPIFVYSGRMKAIALYSFVGGLFQYLIVIVNFYFFRSDPALAAIGYFCYYLIFIPIMWYLALKISPDIMNGLLNLKSFFIHKQVTK